MSETIFRVTREDNWDKTFTLEKLPTGAFVLIDTIDETLSFDLKYSELIKLRDSINNFLRDRSVQ